MDRLHLSTAAIRFAFQNAARRKTGLTAVCVAPSRMGHSRLVTGVNSVEAVERRQLVNSLEAEPQQFPAVEFEVKLVRHHHVGKALIEEAAGADLLVVGRGRDGPAGLLHGSVNRSVVERAQCPVAVVRRQAATTGGTLAIPSGIPARTTASRRTRSAADS